LLDNLTMHKPNLSLANIQDVIDICCLKNLIDERGLNSPVFEGGANFSGGEKQRIELARVLLQNTPIIMLDEPTASLDPATEMQIIHNLRKLDKTIIFIAHRLESIKHCDTILVLENNSLIEQGTHDYLIKQQNNYYRMYTQQGLNVKNI
jgi:ABC-type bacteriocin/lantibiotic exporter with double-glycine peptidase domain